MINFDTDAMASAIFACNARLENGAELNEAFKWLWDDFEALLLGKKIDCHEYEDKTIHASTWGGVQHDYREQV